MSPTSGRVCQLGVPCPSRSPSVKPILYPSYMADPDLIKPYYADSVLANVPGHRILADVLISYFQSQICAAWSAARGHSFEPVSIQVLSDAASVGVYPHLFGGVGARKGAAAPESDDDDNDARAPIQAPPAVSVYPELGIPPTLINTRARSSRPFEEPAPFCASANDLVNPLPPSLFYDSGWNVAHPSQGVSPLLTAAYHWYSTMPLSRLRVPIKIGAGEVGVYYLQEPANEIGEGSQIECWVDDNYGGSVILENSADISDATPTYVPSSSARVMSDVAQSRDHRSLRFTRVTLY